MAQSGDETAKSELHKYFENFLQKYKNFFDSESDVMRLAKQYPDIAAFLGLFVGKKMYHAVASRRWGPSVAAVVGRKAFEICELARELGGEEDIHVIVDMTFFELIAKYDEKGKVRKELKKQGIDYDSLSRSQQRRYEASIPPVGFEGYLKNVFKWRLFKNIEAESKGVIPGVGWCKAYVMAAEDDEEEDINLAEHLSEDNTELIDTLAEMINIDHDWVQGHTCNHPFDKLSVQDRWILKMRFVDRMSSREIGDSIGASTSVVRSRFNDIVNQIQDAVSFNKRTNKYGEEVAATEVKDRRM